MATYIGIVLFVGLYVGYIVYERYALGKWTHIVPLLEVDLDTDAAWKAGDAARLREEVAVADGRRSYWRRVASL